MTNPRPGIWRSRFIRFGFPIIGILLLTYFGSYEFWWRRQIFVITTYLDTGESTAVRYFNYGDDVLSGEGRPYPLGAERVRNPRLKGFYSPLIRLRQYLHELESSSSWSSDYLTSGDERPGWIETGTTSPPAEQE